MRTRLSHDMMRDNLATVEEPSCGNTSMQSHSCTQAAQHAAPGPSDLCQPVSTDCNVCMGRSRGIGSSMESQTRTRDTRDLTGAAASDAIERRFRVCSCIKASSHAPFNNIIHPFSSLEDRCLTITISIFSFLHCYLSLPVRVLRTVFHPTPIPPCSSSHSLFSLSSHWRCLSMLLLLIRL